MDDSAPGALHDASDAALVERIAAGDADAAVRELSRRYSARLYGFGLQRLAGDTVLAEELVQDVFVRLWRSAARFDADRSSVTTFLFLLARRAAIDLHRRAAVRPQLSDREVPDQPGQSTAPDGTLVGIELRRALASLPDHHREPLSLQLEHDLTVQETAARMGVPVGTVKSRRHHALRALRTHLEERGFHG